MNNAWLCKVFLTIILLTFSWNIASASEVKPYSFEQVLNMMMDRHPALSGKRAEVKAKEYASDSARAARYPSVSGIAGYQNLGNQTGTGVNNTSLFTLRARQPIWAFGRIDNGIDYADADVLADKADLLRVKRDLLEKTAVAYAQVLAVYKRQQVIEDNITSHEKLYRQIKRRELGQLASKADSRLALLRLIQARGEKKRVEGDLLLASNELQALIQAPVRKLLPIGDAFTTLPNDINDIEDLALEQSAELQYKQRLLELAEVNTKKERSSNMPTVYLQAERQFNRLGYRNGISYSVMVEGGLDGMGLPSIGRANAADSREVAAEESMKVAHNDIIRKARSLLRNRNLQSDLIKVQSLSVNDMQYILKSYERQYEAGVKSWLEVLNIQREMTDQKLQLAQAESDWLSYSLQLTNLLGGFDAVIAVEEK